MKKIIMYCAFVGVITSCNIPKDGEGENVPTSKLEILTSLGDDDTTGVLAEDSTAVNAEKKKMTE
ncbi:MAG: hypothetical protein Q7W45_07465 [Bacteroidota bacterium]|nr:hypothetical protein [Bacteroidota bacterium]MDP3143980.1 hypothetical protein [Bacteroidota bacterium]MDP3557521.1 hypothetical protein [Bacteroidota bacterium]